MRWREGRRSENIEDRRSQGGAVVAGNVGLIGLRLAVAVAWLGGDPSVILQPLSGDPQGGGSAVTRPVETSAEQVRQLRSRVPEVQSNQLPVRLELQADCLAGVWANRTATGLRSGDMNTCDTFATPRV